MAACLSMEGESLRGCRRWNHRWNYARPTRYSFQPVAKSKITPNDQPAKSRHLQEWPLPVSSGSPQLWACIPLSLLRQCTCSSAQLAMSPSVRLATAIKPPGTFAIASLMTGAALNRVHGADNELSEGNGTAAGSPTREDYASAIVLCSALIEVTES